MGLSVLERGCFPADSVTEHIAHEGLLEYQGRDLKWKERWFILDATKVALIKCVTSSHQRSNTLNSVLGGDVYISDARPLSDIHDQAAHIEMSTSTSYGMEILTTKGTRFRFRTKSLDQQSQWLAAVSKISSGFTLGVLDRLANRELLAEKYSLVRELGRGASGVVSLYTCRGQPFAIKKFMPQKAKQPPNRRLLPPGSEEVKPLSAPIVETTVNKDSGDDIPDDIRREIALLKKASHLPYVIKLHDVIIDQESKQYYLVMEYMGGGAIAEWDGDRKCYVASKSDKKSLRLLDEATVRAYMTNLVLGIQALHLNRICHRDIKPENLMANDDHTMCKIGDLGVAHYFTEENGILCEEKSIDSLENTVSTSESSASQPQKPPRSGLLKSTKGTYPFLPPEALNGDEYCGFKADIWSIGVTMYALLFGYLPYYSTNVVTLFEKIENDPLVFPVECQDDEAKDLLRLILEKDPSKRIMLDGILQHPWLHRNIDSKMLYENSRALKREPPIAVEDREVVGAVSMLQSRFAALSKVTSAATSGTYYTPKVIDTKDTAIPTWLTQDILQLIAAQLHYDWCHTKYIAGWRYGPQRDDTQLIHPCLVPMRELDEDARTRNLRVVEESIKCILALGCRITPSIKTKTRSRSRSSSSSSCANYEVPLKMEHTPLSWDKVMLIDLLAENSHEVWADGYVKNGWSFGETFDATAKTHPSLKPYMMLDEEERKLSREGIASVLKTCVHLGMSISCYRRK